MTIHTSLELERKARHLNQVNNALSKLRRGATLHLSYAPRRHWRLSSGEIHQRRGGAHIIDLPCLVGCGDGLFADELAQTWRYVDGGNNG